MKDPEVEEPRGDELLRALASLRLEIRSRFPERGPALLVANHSGLLPWDGLMLCHAVERFHASGARPRFLVADWLITLPFVQPYLARLGGVRACPGGRRSPRRASTPWSSSTSCAGGSRRSA